MRDLLGSPYIMFAYRTKRVTANSQGSLLALGYRAELIHGARQGDSSIPPSNIAGVEQNCLGYNSVQHQDVNLPLCKVLFHRKKTHT